MSLGLIKNEGSLLAVRIGRLIGDELKKMKEELLFMRDLLFIIRF